MKLGVVISTNDAETVWNAFRLANFSRGKGDEVRVFLIGKGVEYERTSDVKFDSVGEARMFIQAGGYINSERPLRACGRKRQNRNILRFKPKTVPRFLEHFYRSF